MNCVCSSACACKNCLCSHYAAVFSALSNETRLYIVTLLQECPLTVTELAQRSGEEQSTLSHALKGLERAGIVTAHRDGKHRVYTLKKKLMNPLLEMMNEHVTERKERLAKPCCCEVRA